MKNLMKRYQRGKSLTDKSFKAYPVLVRNQGHDYHDYTLLVADDVRVTLSQQQLVSLWKQIELDQKPLSDADIAKLKADLAQIRADGLT